jgi:putative hydrolase of the HAD superfamily
MSFDAIFFDIGNTLFFYNYEFLSALIGERFNMDIHALELCETHKKVRDQVNSEGILSRGHDEVWSEIYTRWLSLVGIEKPVAERIKEAIRTHPFKHLFWACMDEGTPQMLDWFRERGYRLGVISNAEGQIRRLLEHAGIDSKFDVIADSGMLGVTKPDEGIFRYALESVGVKASKSVYVGDIYDIDVIGARRAGMLPVLVDGRPDSGARDCITIACVLDLPSLDIFKPPSPLMGEGQGEGMIIRGYHARKKMSD